MSLASFTYPFLLLASGIKSRMGMASPPIAGIHHLKFPVSDIDVSLAWYTLVLSATHLPELDHFTKGGDRYAVELQMPAFGKTVLELR